jgi:hypothetical protein
MTELYRMVNTLADGRKVYVSRRGRVQLVARDWVESWLRSSMRDAENPDPMVYTADLLLYGNRSALAETRRPYVLIAESDAEAATEPLDPEAFVLGGELASNVGTSGPEDG